MSIEEIALFELGIVVLPGEDVPLHIFEPRYRAMVEDCLERESEFVIAHTDGDRREEIGCAVRIAAVLERMDDGRLNIVCRGTRPVRILEELEDDRYPTVRAQALQDDDDAGGDAEVTALTHEQFARLVRRATDEEPPAERVDELDAYGMAARIDFGIEAKQALLNLRAEGARLELLLRLLRATNKRLDQTEMVGERASQNGKVHFT